MFKKFLVIATLAAGLISTQVSAAFVSTDWKVAGDKLATLDTETGLEWLKLSNTLGESINSVLSKMDSTYLGWRLPTSDEMVAMAQSLNPALNAYFGQVRTQSSEHFAWASAFDDYFGEGKRDGTLNIGYYYNASGVVKRLGSQIGSKWDPGYVWNAGLLEPNDFTASSYKFDHSVFLVSDGGTTLSSIQDPTLNINNPNAPINMADVSDPAGLAAAGLLMLVFGLRRKKGVGYV